MSPQSPSPTAVLDENSKSNTASHVENSDVPQDIYSQQKIAIYQGNEVVRLDIGAGHLENGALNSLRLAKDGHVFSLNFQEEYR